jgi:hypothetical protein
VNRLSEASIEIRQRVSAEAYPFSEYTITWLGQRFYTRMTSVVGDTQRTRDWLIAEFFKRQDRHPTTVFDAYEPVQESVAQAMRADSLIAFAKTGGPPERKRPTLSIVETNRDFH